jgi:hypothetical protein
MNSNQFRNGEIFQNRPKRLRTICLVISADFSYIKIQQLTCIKLVALVYVRFLAPYGNENMVRTKHVNRKMRYAL